MIWRAIVFMVAGGVLGWGAAHAAIGSECRLLGAFYVGEIVFECAEKAKGP